MLIVDALGWLGAVLLLLAYWRVSHGLLDPKGRRYQWLNVAGGALLIVNSTWYGAFPSVAVNVVWILVGLQALLTWRRRSNPE